jgi:chromosome partitioning protein
VKTFVFVNTKGGAGKTSTAIGVAAAWRACGYRVGVVDCDKNASATAWLEEWGQIDSTPVSTDLLPTVVAGAGQLYDILVIDTPPNLTDEIAAIVQVANFVVVPSAPTTLEWQQLQATSEILGASGKPWVVAPVKVRMSTTSGRTIREQCNEYGIPVTRAIVPQTEAAAQAFGEEPPKLSYVGLARELLELLERESTNA